MTYKVSVVVDIDDEDKLGEAVVAKLKAGGKSDSEAKEMVYDGDLVQPLKSFTRHDRLLGRMGRVYNK